MPQAWSMWTVSCRVFCPMSEETAQEEKAILKREWQPHTLNIAKILVKYRINYFFKHQMKAVHHCHVIKGAVLINI